MEKLTDMETKLLTGFMHNERTGEGERFDPMWTYIVVDGSGIEPRQARGVIGSLVKKGLVWVDKDSGAELMGLTPAGKAYVDEAKL